MRPPLRVLLPAAALIAAACDVTSPTLPGAATASLGSAGTADARRVVFLAPIRRLPAGGVGAFDAAAKPVVSLVPGSGCSEATVVTPATGASGSAALKLEPLKLEPMTGTFNAVWQTKGQGLVPGDYQLCVHEDGVLLGSLDVDLVGSASDLRSVPAGTAGLVLDVPMVIRFGITGSAPAVGPPAAIVFTGAPASATAGSAFAVTLEVRDAAGNIVTDAAGTVSVSLTPNTGSSGAVLQGTTTAPLVSGVATFSDLLLNLAGSGYSISAAFGVFSSTSAAFDVGHGPAAAMTLVQGGGQTASVGTAVAIAPGVRIVDAFGNPVPGQSVTFVVGTGGGSVTGANAITDANGVAVVGSWTLGPLFGQNTLVVSSGTLPSITVIALGSFPPPF